MPPVPRGLVYVSDQARGIRRVRRPCDTRRMRRRDSTTLVRRAAAFATPAHWRASRSWPYRRPTRTCGSAPTRAVICRQQGATRAAASSIDITRTVRSARDDHKHSRMLSFGKALDRLRAGVRRDLQRPGLPREKVLALVVKLLDSTQVRVGNAEYARSNGSFGLTTLRDRHARFPARGKALLQFRGKGGAEHDVLVDDARLAKLVRRCQELPGQALFQYVDDDGRPARHRFGTGERLPARTYGRRVHRQGFPHMARDAERGGAARQGARARKAQRSARCVVA